MAVLGYGVIQETMATGAALIVLGLGIAGAGAVLIGLARRS